MLELQQLEKCYGTTRVLQNLSLSITAGEHVALIGSNGAGKSTLFDLISGQQTASAGRIVWRGRDWQQSSVIERHQQGLRRSFQKSSLFAHLSVAEHLRCAGVAASASEQLLRDFSLTASADRCAAHLSYAEQRSLDLILAIGTGGDLILLDEPSAGMSQSETEQCLALIRRYCEGKTLIVVEHDMSVVFALAEKIAVLVAGQLIAYDTPAAIRANPLVQAAYLGQDAPAVTGALC